MARGTDIAGQEFGWLTALYPTLDRSVRGDVFWVVRCRCGVEKKMLVADLRKKPKRSNQAPKTCGCVRRRNKTSKYGSSGELEGSRYGLMKTSAAHRGHVFDVSIEHLWELFLAQGRKCAFTGVPLALSRAHLQDGEELASLDRIDSGKGYVPGNIQWVHPTINFMKHAMPQDQFIMWCCRVASCKGGL